MSYMLGSAKVRSAIFASWHVLTPSTVDAAAALAAKAVGRTLDPAAAKKLLAKIDRNILPLMMVLYAMQFIDKTTLGNSSILGIKTDTHLTTTQYNLLGYVWRSSAILQAHSDPL
jgi:ACS family allantoate permease-like MFS transporter